MPRGDSFSTRFKIALDRLLNEEINEISTQKSETEDFFDVSHSGY